jgi:CheY-like chemotaxis protein
MDKSGWMVLIVEDEDDSLQMVSKILRYHGVRTHSARNGRECIDTLKRIEPTLVIMDLAMPEMDGWETLLEMRANPDTAHIPVVAITAYHSANVAQDAMQAGFDAYFSKPLDALSFVDHLAEVVAA